MAFIKTNKAKGREYHSIAESYREQGKVKHRTLEYIGDISALKSLALKGYLFTKAHDESGGTNKPPPAPCLKTHAHGSVAALLLVADSIGVQGILGQEFPGKTVKGLSRGTVLCLAAIQRAAKPGSKRAFASWAGSTSLPYLAPASRHAS